MINQKLGWLYRRYDTKRRFIRCGVVNEERYLRSSPRLVIVLREANSPDGNWSLPKYLREELRRFKRRQKPRYRYFWKTWKTVGIWSYAIHKGFDGYNKLNSYQTAIKGLLYVGMTNLKKPGGGSTAHLPTIKKHADKYVELWRKELEIMDPEVILCGETFWDVIGPLGLQAIETGIGPYHYAVWKLNGHKTLLIDCYHPANRGNKKRLYEEFGKVATKLHSRSLWHSRDKA